MDNQELIKKIPVYKTGLKQGHPRNEALRELKRLLSQYSFSTMELKILEKEIEENTPDKWEVPGE